MNDYISGPTVRKGGKIKRDTEYTPAPEFWVPPLFNVNPVTLELLMSTQLVLKISSSPFLDPCCPYACLPIEGVIVFTS